jgi:peptide subunit release factor 1 (eRF1)
MFHKVALHEGVIRPSMVAELEAFRASEGRVSSYYLDLDPQRWAGTDGVRIAVEDAMARARAQIDELDPPHAVRKALYADMAAAEAAAALAIGERSTKGLACFVASGARDAKAFRIPWPLRERFFFEEQFILWPLRQILDQSDRYAVILTDRDDARLFLFFLEQLENVSAIKDEIPGRIRFPIRWREVEYHGEHREAFHEHFDRVAEAGLRLLEREPFQHLIIGGLWEVLPQFEHRLHRYLRDRIIARWNIDAQHAPDTEVREQAIQQERQDLENQAREIWKDIQDQRPALGALGPDEVFSALWGRRVGSLLAEPNVSRPGFRCTACGRIGLDNGPCAECGGKVAPVSDAFTEAARDAIEQDAHLRYWSDPALKPVGSLAALKRF